MSEALATYCSDTRALEALPTSTETTFYPDVRTLLTAVLKAEKLPFDVRTGTSEKGKTSHDMPDFVLGDGALFVGVYGEVKRASTGLDDLAVSTEQKDQIGRYLAQTGVVLLCNVRGFGLLVCDPTYLRDGVTPVPPEKRLLQKTVDLWSAVSGGAKPKVDAEAIVALIDIVTRAVTDLARIGAPADLAKILARQARDAKDVLPDDLKPLKPLLDDYRQALGLAFDVDDEKGARFFRSSLVQSVFYALFAAWILWDKKAKADASFDIDDAHSFLPIPFLDALLHDIRHPSRMKHLGLEPHLARAIATLNRVDRPLFRGRMTFPTIDGESSIAAITYFYEPFLEAFDPKLREDLGVWYTPPEIVRYQVRRVHYLLKAELGRPRGLANPDVIVLDPCCGTGAYLLEVARCIAEELIAEGDATTVGLELTTAFQDRVIGFEILTAPFAIAQLQLYLLLEQLGAKPDPDRRLAVFLTNALSGWHEQGDVKLNFPEMREEFDASQQVKRDARIIVVLGNPPYDRFTGAAQAEEAELVAHYKGIKLVEQTNKDGTVKMDGFGRPLMKQRGSSRVYEEFGVKKQLLDDLYIRFIRLAEERIGLAAEYGVVSYISNSSYLTGRSHPLMRRSLLSSFDAVWVDNLNGDKYRTGKMIPKGLPGAGSRDDSAFTTEMDPRGIQPGTAIVTWIKRAGEATAPTTTAVRYRDFWGTAAWKRQALIASLPNGNASTADIAPTYEDIMPSAEGRWRLSPRVMEGGFEAWPALDEVFPTKFQGVNHNRGVEGGVIDASAATLATRLKKYFSAQSFAVAALSVPEIAAPKARYKPERAWSVMKHEGHFKSESIKAFLAFPFDQRSIYYVDDHKWLNEARPEFSRNLSDNEWLITVPEPRKESEAWPLFGTTLVNLHVHERGSVVFPRETVSDDLLAHRDANIAEPAWRVLRDHFGLAGERREDHARAFVGKLFRVAFATLHAPSYQSEHKSALSSDWAHLPITKDADLLGRLVDVGEQVARLLDADRDAREVVEAVLTPERAKLLGQLRRLDGANVSADDLKLTFTYWGGGKGKWTPRPFLETELPAPMWDAAWGERTGDLFLNAQAHFAHVPEAVWTYQLGGYPVLKKWLGYRQADRRDGKPLTEGERRWLRQMIQRVAALLALGPTLDSLYQEAATSGFTAEELGIRY
ncbi:type ISP restriction/modification enzyme [Lichenicoccus sp.]|uniref:type ISP restriction/modification enzyme n=1 Tax=Lichenicoccus sp. TaxID=2781899 RepID=UPI003D10A28F